MKVLAQILAGLVKVASLIAGMIDRRQVESAGEARAEARRAANTDKRERDAYDAKDRASDDLRGPGADRLRDEHFRD